MAGDDLTVNDTVHAVFAEGYDVREVWAMEEAILALTLREPAILISDCRISGLDAAALLTFVASSMPSVLRIVHCPRPSWTHAQTLLERQLAHAIVLSDGPTGLLRATVDRLRGAENIPVPSTMEITQPIRLARVRG